MNILLVCGGVGGSKLALGFYKLRNKIPFSILTNTADDFEHLGLYISPDIDTVTYTLADVVNKDQGWGRDKESWNMLEELSNLGGEDWFKLGDKDLSVHIYRTILLKQGKTLSEITEIISKKFNVKVPIFPMSNDPVQTYIQTSNNLIPFQEYFVKYKCQPEVSDFVFKGIDGVHLNPNIDLQSFSHIVICPSNPFVSIAPIITIPELKSFLTNNKHKVSIVSPIVNGNSLKGPTAKMFMELGQEVSVTSVCKIYKDIANTIFIDKSDKHYQNDLEKMGFRVHIDNLVMNNLNSKINLAKFIYSKIS
tara:strand:+ start:465 stop:1385 length:921 start_codon:yes stop_codon:yes gene_type:complete